MIRSKVVQNGDAYSICVPYTVLEQAGITNEVEMIVEGDRLVIRAAERVSSKTNDASIETAAPDREDETA